MWLEEKIQSSSDKNPRFGFCFLQGKVKIPEDKPLPAEIKDLLTSNTTKTRNFRKAIRLYNSILAFTSSFANVDEKLMAATTGTYNFRKNGGVHHKISSYASNSPEQAKFSQIYIYGNAKLY